TAANLATAGRIPAGNIGQLTFTPAQDINDTNTTSPSFTFKLQDNGGTATVTAADGSSGTGQDTSLLDNTMTISVTSLNDAPVGKAGTVTTIEDSTYTFLTGDFVATNANGTINGSVFDPKDFNATTQTFNAFAGVRITILPNNGQLLLNGNGVA